MLGLNAVRSIFSKHQLSSEKQPQGHHAVFSKPFFPFFSSGNKKNVAAKSILKPAPLGQNFPPVFNAKYAALFGVSIDLAEVGYGIAAQSRDTAFGSLAKVFQYYLEEAVAESFASEGRTRLLVDEEKFRYRYLRFLGKEALTVREESLLVEFLDQIDQRFEEIGKQLGLLERAVSKCDRGFEIKRQAKLMDEVISKPMEQTKKVVTVSNINHLKEEADQWLSVAKGVAKGSEKKISLATQAIFSTAIAYSLHQSVQEHCDQLCVMNEVVFKAHVQKKIQGKDAILAEKLLKESLGFFNSVQEAMFQEYQKGALVPKPS